MRKVVWDSDLRLDCFNKSDENLPRPKSINAKIRHDPGSISDWSPAPAYVAENDPIQNSTSIGSPNLRERKTVSKSALSKSLYMKCTPVTVYLTFSPKLTYLINSMSLFLLSRSWRILTCSQTYLLSRN